MLVYRHFISTALPLVTLLYWSALTHAQTPRPSTQAEDLRIGPRVGVGANSPSSGTDTTTRVETFIPLWQDPGQALTFFEGRLLIDDRGNPGGNVIFGYRQYSESLNRTLGAHLGFDIRNTDNNTFQQLGLGFESLGSDVDFYLNGFWPIGTTQRQTGQSIVDTGLQLSGQPRFAGNALVLDVQRQLQIIRQFEEALPGVDLEIGKQLFRFKNGGDLQAFLGSYFLHSGIRGNTFGARFRVQMQPTRNISAGVGVQHDAFFGTHVLGNITFTWPENRPKGPITQENSVAARMGSSVNRVNNVIVDTPTATEVQTENRAVAAINPATGQPWFFNHVNLGLGNSDGTFESPFGTVAEALAATRGDGNDIVYVAQGTNPGIPAFTIPDNVQVRSQGPIQQIPVAPITSQLSPPVSLNLGMAQLPFSGNGQFPTVTGTVTMRNNTLLSGFAINPNGANGVEAVGVQNVVIDQNQITNADNGIRLQNLTGTVEVTNNVVTQATDDGIDLGLSNTNLNSVLISGNTVSNTGDEGIDVDVYNSSQLNTVTISGNTVNEVGSEASGINLYLFNDSQTNLATISGNIVTTSQDAAAGILVRSINNSTVTTANISENTVTTSGLGSPGIFVQPIGNSTITTANISGNTVTTSGDFAYGITVLPLGDSTITTANISGNTISTSGVYGSGVYVSAVGNSTITAATISGNTITTSGNDADSIYVATFANGTITAATIADNIIPQSGRDGVLVNNYGGNPICASITGNNSTNPAFATAGGTDINLISNGSTFQVVDLANINANNNNAIVNFDGTLVPPGAPPTPPFTNVSACP
ncbi:right-handed parallel beta-helix repeat-containing protein [Acaryochloris sp. IP29b_bin.137]|uniref:right-handed parallel beta-helix repeat-containing protein n=1 Tax=Acaryochloris sp. IP29b_bin.137 TaxID=2969217 RepID=UPI002638E5F7|nr:right-handed parallel beta-helix repeat-containing protein [Acaryochloris sp. IP29b_bin.137]